MSSETPRSLRNIPTESLSIAQAISQRNSVSMADILRQALVSGMLIEAVRNGPDQNGSYAGLSVEYLAKSLRPRLAAPIDLLIEQGQHPYTANARTSERDTLIAPPSRQLESSRRVEAMMFDDGLADDLEGMGMGRGMSASLIGEEDISAPP